MTDQPDVEQLSSTRQSALERHVLLFAPTMGYWKGIYQLPSAGTAVEINGEKVAATSVTAPRAKLLTNSYPCDAAGTPWKKRLQQIELRKNNIVESLSLPFPIHGIRIIPKSRGNEFFRELFGETVGSLKRRIDKYREQENHLQADQLQQRLNQAQARGMLANDTPLYDPARGDNQSIAYELHQLATEFYNQYDNIKQQIQHNNTTYSLVAHKLPSQDAIMDKFFLDCVPIEIAGGRDTSQVTEMDLAEHQDVVRSAVHRHTTQAIETLIQGPRAKLAEALGNLKELIARDGKVTQKSFNPVRAAIAKIRMFDFVANEDLLREMDQLDNLLGNTIPTSLDSTSAANNGFNAALDRYINEVEDEQQAARDLEEFGREQRDITF